MILQAIKTYYLHFHYEQAVNDASDNRKILRHLQLLDVNLLDCIQVHAQLTSFYLFLSDHIKHSSNFALFLLFEALQKQFLLEKMEMKMSYARRHIYRHPLKKEQKTQP